MQTLHTSHRNIKVRPAFHIPPPKVVTTSYRRFGWFWECPNGENCQYRHALPPGFVLKSQRKAAADAAKANTISIEEFLEVEVGLF
jgi:hypothetical protein